METEQLAQIQAELDAAHARAKQAYRAKDLQAYMELFAPDLAYKQLDGRVIGREQLQRQVEHQFASVKAMDTSYMRESLEVSGDEITEVLTQKAWAEVVAFLVIKRTWRLERRGRYVWVKTGIGWQIRQVEVLTEQMQ